MKITFAYKYVRINRGILKSVIRNDPLATEPRWYLINFESESQTGESVGFLKYHAATAPAKQS